jgi:hypothetical protein
MRFAKGRLEDSNLQTNSNIETIRDDGSRFITLIVCCDRPILPRSQRTARFGRFFSNNNGVNTQPLGLEIQWDITGCNGIYTDI